MSVKSLYRDTLGLAPSTPKLIQKPYFPVSNFLKEHFHYKFHILEKISAFIDWFQYA